MKRLLYILIVASGLAGCAEKMTDTGSSSDKGELERSYISVTLKSDDASVRAGGSDEYEYGDAAERYVENVHFFLFKGDGTAFPISPAGNRNYLSFNINSNGTQPDETGNPNEGPNVSDVKDKILVFDNYKGEYPEYIVAVLNWDAKYIQPSYSLDNLYNALAGIRNTNDHFVMSTSVYADMLGKVVRANALTVENIAKTEDEAKELCEEQGLVLSVVDRVKSEYEEGIVCKQTTQANTKLLAGAKVEVVVSDGLKGEEIEIPQLRNKSEKAAKDALLALGFAEENIEIIEREDDDVDAGRVIATLPGDGSKVTADAEIQIIVSKGAGQIMVPRLLGNTAEDAKKALEEAGLTFLEAEVQMVPSTTVELDEKVWYVFTRENIENYLLQ